MKITLLVVFVLNIAVVHAQNYWLSQNSPTNKELLRCFFADSLTGWVSGDSGIILNTTNAGASWNIQQSGISDYKIEDIFFLNKRLGWAISNDYLFIGTTILKTTNGGVSWNNSRLPDSAMIFNTIYFFDSLIGFLGGETGNIFRTSNGGVNWLPCVIDSNACPYLLPKHDFCFINALTGFSCGGTRDFAGLIWKTSNGGLNWSSYCLAPEPLNEIKYIGAGNLAAVGGDFEFGSSTVYTSNNGNNWSYSLTQCFGSATGFSFRTPAECWTVLSFSELMAVNLDSMKPGTMWQCIPSPGNARLNDIEFTTPYLGWAFGSNGSIFKYNPDVIGVNGNQNHLPEAYSLFQNYPNPFNPVTTIEYSIPKSENIIITVYDVLGNKLKVYNEGLKVPGSYSIEINGEELSSGVYFYRLVAGGFAESRKMVLLK